MEQLRFAWENHPTLGETEYDESLKDLAGNTVGSLNPKDSVRLLKERRL